jgi:chemotaxis protein methyltransferase CheR
MTLPEQVAREAQELIALRLGLELSPQRQADLERALGDAAAAASVPAAGAYLSRLRSLPGDSGEWRHLAAALTIGETYFFRDAGVFQALEERVLPELIAARRSLGCLRLRLWSAGCATGEEPYSLAILLDRLLPDRAQWSLTLLATDLNARALESARHGLYREWALRATPAETRDRYFSRRGDAFRLAPEIRRMVAFAPLNLAEDVYPEAVTDTTAMDLILCRNVLMYFTRDAQRATSARLGRSLSPSGWLALSPAEASADLLRPLVPVSLPEAIFYRRDGAQPPALPSWDAPLATEGDPPPAPSALSVVEPALGAIQPRASEPTQGSDGDDAGPGALSRARELADLGRLEEARDLCRNVLAADRLNSDAYVLLAAVAQEQGAISEALEALRSAIYLAPDSGVAHFLLGALLWRQGERRRARPALAAAARLLAAEPGDAPLAGGGGLTAERLKQTAQVYLELR